MELKLTDGKYVLGEGRAPEELDGAAELAQRAALRLQVHRGAFLPLPEYGSRLWQLGRVSRAERETAARQFVLEALSDETALTLETLELVEGADGDAALKLTLSYAGGTLDLPAGI